MACIVFRVAGGGKVRFFAVNGGSTKIRDNCDFPLSSMVEWTQLKVNPSSPSPSLAEASPMM